MVFSYKFIWGNKEKKCSVARMLQHDFNKLSLFSLLKETSPSKQIVVKSETLKTRQLGFN